MHTLHSTRQDLVCAFFSHVLLSIWMSSVDALAASLVMLCGRTRHLPSGSELHSSSQILEKETSLMIQFCSLQPTGPNPKTFT